jgi:hypothetical protein
MSSANRAGVCALAGPAINPNMVNNKLNTKPWVAKAKAQLASPMRGHAPKKGLKYWALKRNLID